MWDFCCRQVESAGLFLLFVVQTFAEYWHCWATLTLQDHNLPRLGFRMPAFPFKHRNTKVFFKTTRSQTDARSRWDEMSCSAERRKRIQQVLSICWKLPEDSQRSSRCRPHECGRSDEGSRYQSQGRPLWRFSTQDTFNIVTAIIYRIIRSLPALSLVMLSPLPLQLLLVLSRSSSALVLSFSLSLLMFLVIVAVVIFNSSTYSNSSNIIR